MNSKERVRRAIRFQKPDRIPYHLPESYGSDILWLFISCKKPDETGRDEWGSVWSTLDDESMGEVVQCALPEWDLFDHYSFPDINNLARYKDAKEQIEANTEEKYVLGTLSTGIFARTMHLRGLDQVMMDLYVNEAEIAKLTDKLVELAVESVDIWHGMGADGILGGFDDWGLQDRLMINPDKWREFYKPRYVRIWQHAKSKGMDVFLHCCGNILSILDDMIEAGLDVINMDQQENMGLEVLSERYGGRICFWNPSDIQTVMITGTPDDVKDYVRKQMLLLSRERGGFIGKYYPQPKAIGHPQENIEAMCRATVEFSCVL